MVIARLRALILAGMLAGAAPLATPPAAVGAAPACATETEPNDAVDGLGLLTGPLCVEGTLPSGDQDLLLWELAPADAATSWTIELDGVGGSRTSLRLIAVASPPGSVPLTPGNQLLQVDAPPEVLDPVVRDGLVLPVGTMIVGISRSGMADGSEPPDVGYRFSVAPAAPLASDGEREPNDGPDTATPVEGAFLLGADAMASQDKFAWTVPGTQDGSAWTLRLRGTIGRGLSLTMYGPGGTDLAWGLPVAGGDVIITDLRLDPGTYRVLVSGSPSESAP